jgi:hypothetical protein
LAFVFLNSVGFKLSKKPAGEAMKKFMDLTNLGYSRAEVAANARRRLMKLWFTTANGPQRSRSCEIGSPEGEKMPTYDDQFSLRAFLYMVSADFMNNSG